MPHSPAPSAPHPAPEDRDVPGPSAVGPEESGADEGAELEFGLQEPTRFAADVEYRGRSGGRDYLVRVRHRLLDTSATVVIDGVEHDPKAEEKALKAAEKAERAGEEPEPAVEPLAERAGADGDPAEDGLRFRCEDGFTSLRLTVRRPGADGEHEDAEVIHVRTVGLGGAGEVDVRRSFGRVMLVPTEGSPSAAREEKRAARPTRYALVAALTKSARYLIPLLGLGALFSGLLDPLLAWAEEKVRPIIEAISAFLTPIREWISELTRPVREFLSALLRPIAEFRDWLVELLFGWVPELSLPFSIPEWVVDVAIPLILVVVIFVATFREVRRRGKRLEAARKARGGADEGGEDSSSTAPPRPER